MFLYHFLLARADALLLQAQPFLSNMKDLSLTPVAKELRLLDKRRLLGFVKHCTHPSASHHLKKGVMSSSLRDDGALVC